MKPQGGTHECSAFGTSFASLTDMPRKNQMRVRDGLQLLFFGFAACSLLLAAPKKPSSAAFMKLQSLNGDWESAGEHATTNFKVVVADTTVMETLAAHGMEEMLTLYTVDRDGIALVHYCPTNNQPRMRAVPQSADVKELVFQFTGAGNLPELATGHEHKLVMRFEDENHITEEWTWRKDGKDSVTVYHFTRQQK